MFKPMKHTPQTRDKEENSKYLSKNCHHHIKCIAATFLVALMWRRPLNSVTLAAAAHKGLKGVCKAQMMRNSLYKVEKPP